jgi:ubiquinone/menaquinone biosynthesis C-methylase UbiE
MSMNQVKVMEKVVTGETTPIREGTPAPEMDRLKSGMKSMWMAGDYDRFSRYMEGGSREFFERLDVAPGCRLLDVACGSGQLALVAAREGVNASGADIAGNLVDRARVRAAAEGLRATFHEADAEDLPFEEGTFDVVLTLFGAMFAPRPERVAREMLRVCSPGGTIAMGNWTAEGFVGRMFKTISRFIAPSGVPSPLLWGNEAAVRERLAPGVSELNLTRRHFLFDYPFPPEEVVDLFIRYYGPTTRAFATLDEEARSALRRGLVGLWSAANLASRGITVVKAEYLEVIGLRS